MGQESSTLVDEHTPPRRLTTRSVVAIADLINEGRAKKIVVITGAGISTSAGIPDFRSPNTGIYANLARLNLPYPDAVFDISYFRKNPLPFYTLAHEIYPGRHQPTIAHYFIRLLSDKGLLLKLFTQNIDCLERQVGIPDNLIVEAHGSFARQSCIECKTSYPDDLMQKAITNRDVPCCLVPQCNGLVKPEIVFFGEALPSEFFKTRDLPNTADLAIILGTSLSVHPFASLPDFVPEVVPRILINKELVGSLGCRRDDVLLLGDCDDGVCQLASALGWLEELENLRNAALPIEFRLEALSLKNKTKDENLQDEIAELTKDVDEVLQISSTHVSRLREQLDARPDDRK